MSKHGFEHIEDRTDRTGCDSEFYIVTGSIGPQFDPVTFDSYTKAWQHARKICLYGIQQDIRPRFKPCIEGRSEPIKGEPELFGPDVIEAINKIPSFKGAAK